jgi:hypothetical protein
MKSSELLTLSRLMRVSALRILNDLEVVDSCHHVGGIVNTIGSLKTDLMLNHRDIDLHIYTEEPMVEKSFSFMQNIAKNRAVKDIQYKNLLDTKEECIEWHLWCEDKERNPWKVDIIHIRKGSFYDGFFEKVTNRIIERLTPETKIAILGIKHGLGETSNVPGIQIYYAVLEHHIKSYADFVQWSAKNPVEAVLEWMP